MAAVTRRTLLLMLLKRRLRKKTRYKKRMWVRKIFEERKTKGEFYLLVQDLRLYDEEYFFKYFRMSVLQYEELLSMVAPLIQKSSQKRECIGPNERLCVTMRYLTTGDAQTTVAMNYRISPASVGRIIYETCEALWQVLSPYLQCPKNETDWKRIANEFNLIWNFPHCIGALDGKHVVMQAPENSGSSFFNYKKTHSIVLMAICDAHYKFTMVDIGDSGRNSDGGVFANSQMGEAFVKKQLHIPDAEALPGTQKKYPYVLVGDEAFQLQQNLMKPYPREVLGIRERIFNYRLSRARRIIENTFGIAAARFRIFRRPIHARVDMVVNVTKAVVSLHNYLMKDKSFGNASKYCPVGFTDTEGPGGTQLMGEWRNVVERDQGLKPLKRVGSNNYSRSAKMIREDFCTYFISSTGQVPWQWHATHSAEDAFDINK